MPIMFNINSSMAEATARILNVTNPWVMANDGPRYMPPNIETTANDGFYTDNIDQRGSGSYGFQVCEEGSATCSNQVLVTFG